MAKHVLKESQLRALQLGPGINETMLYDGEGLALRVRASRDPAERRPVCAWQYWHQADGARRKVSLGSYPAVGIAAARKKADDYRKHLASGGQLPPRRAAAPIVAPVTPTTVAELMARWQIDYLQRHHKDQGAAARAAYDRHVAAQIGRRKLIELRKGDVLNVVDRLAREDKGRTAAGILALLRQMFRWGIRRDYMTADPTLALSKAEFAGKSASRERVLSADELKDLAARLGASRRAGPAGRERSIPVLPLWTQAAVWVMLGTLARVGELSRARWEHIDLDAAPATWVIPSENSKNRKAHLVHLSAFAVRHLRRLHQYAAGSAWVLPNRDGSDHLDPKAITKQLRDRQQPDAARPRLGRSSQRAALMLPGGVFTAHDLRRTGATLMQALGIPTEVIERSLNHVEEDRLVRTYQRAELLPERANAFARLGVQLDRLVPPAATQHLMVTGATR